MKKMMKDNKGFTLVELVIAFGILAIAMVIISSVIGMSSGMYRNISSDLNLQYESQLAMSQIQEYVIDCNDSVAWVDNDPNDVLYLFNRQDGEETVYDGYKLALDGNTLKLYTNSTAGQPMLTGFDTGQPMSSNVQSFDVQLAPDAKSVEITLEYKLGAETYTGIQTIAFRNPVTVIS